MVYNIELTAAVMNGHVAPFAIVFAVGEELVHKFREREPSLLKDACFSVLAEENVLLD